ncbi:MAG: DUF2333 family protein [Moraxellaceae bacterium]|nr:DUF2333 family protein [Moraxellaceae bacterium]
MDAWQDRLGERLQVWREQWALADRMPLLMGAVLLSLLLLPAFGWYWSREPAMLELPPAAEAVPGQVLAGALSDLVGALHDKPGGYLRNDLLPPGLLLDNIPSWELGVLRQTRDMTRALHRDMGLSHARFVPDDDLALAETALNVNPDSWMFPRAEAELRQGQMALQRYRTRLGERKATFEARPAYLARWLGDVDATLGQRATLLNAALASAAVPVRGTGVDVLLPDETPWRHIDNVFYEARGEAWALLYLLKAVEIEFGPELERRQAALSLRAAIHELEATQQAVWSPVILNGSGFGLFANHSLVLANYLGRARADLADVAGLLRDPG